MENMYRIMNRIGEIRKRFGVMRHNNAAPGKTPGASDYQSLQKEALTGSVPEKPGSRGSVTGGRDVDHINRLADHYAKKNNVPPRLVKAIIETESAYDADAVSGSGAMGLMQLMPQVMKETGVIDPFIPAENIRGGVEHLKKLLTRYNGDYKRALAAYNAGMKKADKTEGVPDIRETREYVDKVIQSYLKNR